MWPFGRYGTLRGLMASPFGPVLLASLGIAGYYLWTNHREHLADVLPYLPLAACLLLHGLMHRGHGHDAASGKKPDDRSHPDRS